MRRTFIADHSISQALQGILAVTSSQWRHEPASQPADGARQEVPPERTRWPAAWAVASRARTPGAERG